MRVAIISPYISTSPDPEFYQSQQLNLGRELQAGGVDVEILTARRTADQSKRSTVEGVTVHRLEPSATWMESRFNMLVLRGLRGRLSRGGYDIVQSSDDCAPSTFTAARFCAGGPARLVVFQGVYQYSASLPKRALMVLQDRLTGPVVRRHCRVAVCKTGRAADFLRRKGFGDVRVVPVGVDRRLFHPGDRRPAGSSHGGRAELLAVGNLIPLKNYPLMIDVVRRLSAAGRTVRLTVIGSGPERERILGLAREYGLGEERFRLLEGIPNREMRRFYSAADLFLLLSDREVFGMVMLEAMACGCPVLATPTPGPLEVIDDGVDGFLVRDSRAEPLAAQLDGILADGPSLAIAGERAAVRADRAFGWEAIAARYLEIYRELCGEPGAGSEGAG